MGGIIEGWKKNKQIIKLNSTFEVEGPLAKKRKTKREAAEDVFC